MRVFDESVCELGDVNESVLMNSNVDESAEGRHVRDHPFQHHFRSEVFRRLDVVVKARRRFRQPAMLDPKLRRLIEVHGGVRKNQCLYLQSYEDGLIAFAALWPWSGGDPITLKVGLLDPETP